MANDGTVKIGVEVDEKEFQSGLSKLGSVAKAGFGATTAAFKAATVAATAGAVAVGKLAQSAVSAYSDYEQLVGGVETLFKTSSDTVMEYANNAYKTAGLSANEYMDTVTSFSASLLQGLGGDTEAAAQIADKAITDMADNANKMGTDMASIQYAYQGFAKQNYTMLDNLKLGYGGTQAEMARLINDSGVLGDTMEVTAQTVNQVSFDKIIEAIHVVQDRLGITGTTAKEASETIQGSINAMKGAWENFITGMADGEQDIGQLTENLVDSVLTVADNLVPRLQEILPRLAEGLAQLAANLLPYIPPTLETLLPALIDGSTALFIALADTLPALISTAMSSLPSLIDAAMQILAALGTGIMDSLPELLEAGVQIIVYLAQAIADALPELIPAIVEAITTIVETLTEPDNLVSLGDAAFGIVQALAEGLVAAFPKLIEALPKIIENIGTFFTDHAPELLGMGVQIVQTLIDGILASIPALAEALPKIIETYASTLSEWFPECAKIGIQILVALINGIISAIPLLVESLPDIISAIVGAIPDLLGGIIEAGANILDALVEGIITAIPNLVGALPKIIGAIVETIMSLLGSVVDLGKQIVSSLIDGITSGVKSSGGSGGGSSGGASRPRARMAAAPANVTDGSGEEGASITAGTFSRTATVRALESAIPNVESRVALATASMAPAAGYSAPPPVQAGGGGNGGNTQAPIILRPNWTIQFQGDTAQLGRVLDPIIKDEDRRKGSGV